jgi:hypothetical protein
MDWLDILFFINFGCMIFSGNLAIKSFKDGNDRVGWLNLFASALNGAIFFDHFF